MNEEYLLNNDISKTLFHIFAEKMPIIDFHNHLCVHDLSMNRQYENIAELWVKSDPYKHRAMRICGIDEKYITGAAADREKFRAWLSVLPKLVGNPLYDWSVLEMKRVFGIEFEPDRADADRLWQETGALLKEADYRAGGILDRFHVEYAAPCTEIDNELEAFKNQKNLAPSLRSDRLMEGSEICIRKLEQAADMEIQSLEDYFKAIAKRLDAFEQAGCRFSDHALDNGFSYFGDDGNNPKRFDALRRGEKLKIEDRRYFASAVLRFLAGEYAERGWTMQLHIGAQRFTSSRLRALAGGEGGFAGIGNCCSVESVTSMLDDFEKGEKGLPAILLFTLNPSDNAVMSVLSGSYTRPGASGWVQQGTAWWWCDHIQGMRQVFETISAFGVLSVFLGMTTDSRSLLSFVRHEYFRRVFCGWLGEKIQRGEIIAPAESIGQLVENICYWNIKRRLNGAET